MAILRPIFVLPILGLFLLTNSALGQSGSIRGVVRDRDFEVPLSGTLVRCVEIKLVVKADARGNYLVPELEPGAYTLVFSKAGYAPVVRADIQVVAGQLTDLDVGLSAEFAELEEFVVRDVLRVGTGSESELLQLRFESPSLMDSISADLMSRAGASDAADALLLVSGATVQDGKYAVIRGLPDRYVSSKMNGVRLPTADEDKRAVELDQFPSAVIESIQITKTFTPDQQGDASGGAVDLILKGIPQETTFAFKGQLGWNSETTGSDFLSYDGGGVGALGRDDGRRDQQLDKLGENWEGAVGVRREDAPQDFKGSVSGGTSVELDSGWRVGGFTSLFYERSSASIKNARDDSLWVVNPGDPLTPRSFQGTPGDGDFKTALFDVDQSTESVQWGGLSTLGVENDNHAIGLTFLYTRSADDKTTLAEDTRGKEYYFPGYDRDDPMGPGNFNTDADAAPYVRTETLEYTERTTRSLQLHGSHKLPIDPWSLGAVQFYQPTLDWAYADSSADFYQPDKRQFGSIWTAASYKPGAPPFIDPFTAPNRHSGFKPGANFNLGNLQRIWKRIEEDSDQLVVDLKLPFDAGSLGEGYFKFGLFNDKVVRSFDQDTFSNFGDSGSSFEGGWEDYWSDVFSSEPGHPIIASEGDVDYSGTQEISAVYGMLDMPIAENLTLVGGARLESTSIGIVNTPEGDALWFPPGSVGSVALGPGDADVTYQQKDLLPSLGLSYEAMDGLTIRTAFSRTVARQTFKELSPIQQQEFLGGPVFIGNPGLEMSGLTNWDLRADWVPGEGSLLSLSYFYKDIERPIEYVQAPTGFNYTTPVNYPKGRLSGVEFELRQDLGTLSDRLRGLRMGLNATFISSEVILSAEEQAGFNLPSINAPISSRDMTGAPEHLYNLYFTYDFESTGTQLALFYTVKGDTLVAGAGQADGNFIPSVYAKEYGTLNLSLSQKFAKHWSLQLQAKNLTDPHIDEVYRSDYTGADAIRSSYREGIDYSISLSFSF